MKRMVLLAMIAWFSLTWSPWTKGEYRAFLLQIKSPHVEGQDPATETRTVKSSLDPWQYAGFYPLKPTETITYIDTWRCTGNTGHMQPTCKSPKEIAAEKAEEAKANGGAGASPENPPGPASTAKVQKESPPATSQLAELIPLLK